MSLRRVSQGETPEGIVVHFSLVAAVFHGLLALVVAPAPDKSAIAPMIATGVCAGLAQIAMTRAYSLARAARVGAMGYLAIVVSAAMGALLLHEPLSPHAALGMGLVISGGLVIGWAGLREKRTV
jgi:drug/metabolite transporter (DMT)-like permease